MTVKELKRNLEDFSDDAEVVIAEWIDNEMKIYHATRGANIEHQKEVNQLWLVKNELRGLIN